MPEQYVTPFNLAWSVDDLAALRAAALEEHDRGDEWATVARDLMGEVERLREQLAFVAYYLDGSFPRGPGRDAWRAVETEHNDQDLAEQWVDRFRSTTAGYSAEGGLDA